MTFQKFSYLYVLNLLAILALFLLLSFKKRFYVHFDILYYAFIPFTLLCVGVFFFTKLLKKAEDHKGLLNMIVLNVITKMLISAAIIAVYMNVKKPVDGSFIVPFLVIYVCFTIFETYFMSEQARV